MIIAGRPHHPVEVLIQGFGWSWPEIYRILGGPLEVTPALAHEIAARTTTDAEFWVQLQMGFDAFLLTQSP